MAQDVVFRFRWSKLDKARCDRVLRNALRKRFGIQLSELPPDPDPVNIVDDVEYEVAIPERFARDHRGRDDAPLPVASDGLHVGRFSLRADDRAGASLSLDWNSNAHVWTIMRDIVESVATEMDGWVEQPDGAPEPSVSLGSWDLLKRWTREAYGIDEDPGAAAFAVTMTWDGTPRKQKVSVASFEDRGESWISLRSGICRRGRITVDAAQRKNNELTFGKIVQSPERYELVYCFPQRELTSHRFISLLERVSEIADDLESELSRGSDEF